MAKVTEYGASGAAGFVRREYEVFVPFWRLEEAKRRLRGCAVSGMDMELAWSGFLRKRVSVSAYGDYAAIHLFDQYIRGTEV